MGLGNITIYVLSVLLTDKCINKHTLRVSTCWLGACCSYSEIFWHTIESVCDNESLRIFLSFMELMCKPIYHSAYINQSRILNINWPEKGYWVLPVFIL